HMKRLLEKTKLTTVMLEQIVGSIQPSAVSAQPSSAPNNVGTAAPGCPPERSSGLVDEGAEPAVQPAPARDFSSAIGQSLAQLLKRPEVVIENLAPVLRELSPESFAYAGPATSLLLSAVRNELKS